jgi:hypothetical protein
MGRALFDADVHAAVIERLADSWMLEFIAPADGTAFVAAMRKIGVHPLQAPIDTTTGMQAGPDAFSHGR